MHSSMERNDMCTRVNVFSVLPFIPYDEGFIDFKVALVGWRWSILEGIGRVSIGHNEVLMSAMSKEQSHGRLF